jgi:hypothetical protein
MARPFAKALLTRKLEHKLANRLELGTHVKKTHRRIYSLRRQSTTMTGATIA